MILIIIGTILYFINPINKEKILDLDEEVEKKVDEVILEVKEEVREKQENVEIDGHGYCYIGSDRGVRTCIDVSVGDTCMSGKLFPRRDICVNPSLRL